MTARGVQVVVRPETPILCAIEARKRMDVAFLLRVAPFTLRGAR